MGEPYNKLVRDKIPEMLPERGIPFEQRTADEKEYGEELVRKLNEEVKEFTDSGKLEKLADVLEVVQALQRLPQYRALYRVAWEKRQKRGGFDKRIILKGEKN